MILLISASQVAGIIGVSHHAGLTLFKMNKSSKFCLYFVQNQLEIFNQSFMNKLGMVRYNCNPSYSGSKVQASSGKNTRLCLKKQVKKSEGLG
jgi:hypothetical protein